MEGLVVPVARWASTGPWSAVDLVVEQQDVQIDVAPQRVHQVIAADGQAVAVAGDDPDIQFGIGQLHAGGDAGARPWMVWKP